MKKLFLGFCALLFISPALAWADANSGPHLATTRMGKLNEGYSILFDLAEQEKSANLIFLFKTGTPATKEITKAIADTFAHVDHDLETWANQDSEFDIKVPHLPFIEKEARSVMSKDHTHDLFAAKGAPFDHLFLTLQWQSLYYAMGLTHVLQREESNPERLRALEQYEREFRHLQAEVYGMIQ